MYLPFSSSSHPLSTFICFAYNYKNCSLSSPLPSSAPTSASSRLLVLSQGTNKDSSLALVVRDKECGGGEGGGEAEKGGVDNKALWADGEGG